MARTRRRYTDEPRRIFIQSSSLTVRPARRTMRPVPVPEQIYLRDREGESIGPLPRRALEVLFDSRVVDEGTPVSENGLTYKALRDFPELYARILEVKDLLVSGADPWTSAPSAPAAAVVAKTTGDIAAPR